MKAVKAAIYVPTAAQSRRWAREAQEAAKFYVTYYRVIYDERVQGTTTCTFPLSPPLSSEAKGLAALKRLRRKHPFAKLIRGTHYYDKKRRADVLERKEFLAEMR